MLRTLSHGRELRAVDSMVSTALPAVCLIRVTVSARAWRSPETSARASPSPQTIHATAPRLLVLLAELRSYRSLHELRQIILVMDMWGKVLSFSEVVRQTVDNVPNMCSYSLQMTRAEVEGLGLLASAVRPVFPIFQSAPRDA